MYREEEEITIGEGKLDDSLVKYLAESMQLFNYIIFKIKKTERAIKEMCVFHIKSL
jgi:hypothetical protein